MLLIHVPRLTNRLGYTLNVVFKLFLRLDFQITTDFDIFFGHNGEKLCYGSKKVGDAPFIRSADLLFQTTIDSQSVRCFSYDDTKALFPVYNKESILPFDPFAAIFFCLSRYEEYLPHLTDSHGRFPATESLAYKERFLHQAVVDRWAMLLADKLRESYPDMQIPARQVDVEDTFDIDAAYCYKHKGLFRTLIGTLRDVASSRGQGLVRDRYRVIFNKQDDPFDSFDYIIGVSNAHPGKRLNFFPLMADYNVNDKPISYLNKEFRQLLQHLSDNAKMGIHLSYASYDNPSLIPSEIERLSSLLHRKMVRNRFHFLRFRLPQSYQYLLEYGITHDYSMGYADEPGFRAGTGTPYPFFDLESDSETQLIIHPFPIMDSTLKFYKGLSAKESEPIYRQFIDEVRHVGCTLSLLWHNQSLCEDFGWQGWRGLYESVVEYAVGSGDK